MVPISCRNNILGEVGTQLTDSSCYHVAGQLVQAHVITLTVILSIILISMTQRDDTHHVKGRDELSAALLLEVVAY